MKTPDLHDWLLGQTDRDDLVGTLARICVSESAKIRESGLDTWLIEKETGLILQPAVDEARQEHARCVHELNTVGHSETFPILFRAHDEERQAASWKKHKAEPAKTPETYLHERHKELRQEVERQSRLYLDTNHWIRLLNIGLGRSRPGDESYVSVLAKLRALRSAGKLVCPLSFPLFHELLKQTDPNTRRKMAVLMDELSAGVCIQPPHQLERIELKRQIVKSVLGPSAPDLGEWVWVKASAVFGESIVRPESDALPKDEVRAVQKVMIDAMWDMPLAALAEFPEDLGPDFYDELAQAYVKDAEDYRTRGVPFERVLMEQKTIYVRQLLVDSLPKLGQEVWDQFPTESAANQARGGNRTFDPSILASIQIKAAVFASFIVSTKDKKIVINDVIDALHASMALPHFDAACLDRGMAHRLTSPPLNFQAAYRARVFATPGDLLTWLSSVG